jgi:hypothetical protein
VPNTRRMCLMNLFLHSIGELDGEPLVERSDALISEPKRKVDYVLANPPFGKKSSMTFTNEEGEQETDNLTYNRQDFWATTSNKQLNFVQHIRSLLKIAGRAAVVVPDKSVLNHDRFDQTHADWYHKLNFALLSVLLKPENKHRIYIDLKDTHSAHKMTKLHEVLCNNAYEFDLKIIGRVQVELESDWKAIPS